MNQKDVLDETYRKAVKMDPDDFSILFSPATIMNIVQERLFPEANSDAVLDAQLYKLNVYGTLMLSRPGAGSLSDILQIYLCRSRLFLQSTHRHSPQRCNGRIARRSVAYQA